VTTTIQTIKTKVKVLEGEIYEQKNTHWRTVYGTVIVLSVRQKYINDNRLPLIKFYSFDMNITREINAYLFISDYRFEKVIDS
jgi:hypothetical protein